MTKPISLFCATKKKKDRIDASNIADCLRCDFLPECHMASTEIWDRRRTLRYSQPGAEAAAGVMARNRIGGKDPKYPSDAKSGYIEGRVVLEATISDSGKVEDLCVIQGPEDTH